MSSNAISNTNTNTNTIAVIYIPPTSPLLQYSPSRNGPSGSSWVQIPAGGSQVSGPATFALQLDDLHFSQVVFTWSATGDYHVSVGLDGALQSGSASSGGVTLSASQGQRSARLETTCSTCGPSGTFTLLGIKLATTVSGNNATLDDSSSEITYQGFTSTSNVQSTVPAIHSGSFYQNTISYTSSAGSSASFSFTGSALYIYGPTGPQFGTYQVQLDQNPCGTYNGSTTVDFESTLLWFTSDLGGSSHSIKITNEEEGKLFALDYIVAVSGDSAGAHATTLIPTYSTAVTTTAGITNTAPTATTAVFPQNAVGAGHNGDAGGAIGGTLGALCGITLLWLLWRYRAWKRAGGQGNFLAALCGAWAKAAAPAAKEDKFKLWPMMSFKPKYDT